MKRKKKGKNLLLYIYNVEFIVKILFTGFNRILTLITLQG